MESLGQITKNIFFKGICGDEIHEEFTVKERQATVTLSTALITANVTNISVDGVAIAPITFDTDHATTMGLIVAALEALATVESASFTGNVLTIVAADQTKAANVTAVVTAGATQPTITIADIDNTVYPGMPVVIDTDGKIKPAAAADSYKIVGLSIHERAAGKLATVGTRGLAIVEALANANSTVPGPVKYSGFDVTTKKCKYSSDTVTSANCIGFALEGGDAGDEIKVLVKE